MKKKSILVGLAAFLALGTFGFSNGLNLNSLGSRALAMGGAFVSVADDYSAVFWNPAGLTNIKNKTVGFYGTDIMPSGTYSLTIPYPWNKNLGLGTDTNGTKVIDTKTVSKAYLGFMAAYIHPISENLVAGIGVYTPSGLGANWDGSQMKFISGFGLPAYPTGRGDITWSSKIGMVTIAPTLAYKLSDAISVGAQLNINYATFDINMYAGNPIIPTISTTVPVDLGQYTESDTGWGVGATLGIQYKADETTHFGFTVRTPSTIKFSGTTTIAGMSALGLATSSPVTRDVTWPWWVAAGMSVRATKDLVLSFDYQWTGWAKLDTLPAVYTATGWSALMDTPDKNAKKKDVRELYWENTGQFRIGAEYKVTDALAIRAGYYSDPAPAPNRTMNILLPSYNFHVVTFGAGYTVGNLQADLGFEYFMGTSRDVAFLSTFDNTANGLFNPLYVAAQPGSYGMNIFVPSISVTYHF